MSLVLPEPAGSWVGDALVTMGGVRATIVDVSVEEVE
jgi:hypothetical protein